MITQEQAALAVGAMTRCSSWVAAAYWSVAPEAVVRWLELGLIEGRQVCAGVWLIECAAVRALGPDGRPEGA